MKTKGAAADRLWTRDFILICSITMMIRVCNQMLNTALPLYVLDLGYNKSLAGLTATFFTIAALVTRPFFGTLVDSKGRKKFLLFGTILYAVSVSCFGLVASVPLIYILRILGGIGLASHGVALSTMCTDVLPESRMAEGLGYYGLTTTLGLAIASPITLALTGSVGYEICFAVIFFASLVAVFLCFPINYEKKNMQILIDQERQGVSDQSPQTELALAPWEKLFERHALLPSAIIICTSFAYSGLSTFIPTFAKEMGIENIGIFFTVSAVSLGGSRLIIGRLGSRFGNNTMLLASLAVMLAMNILICFSVNLPMLLVASFFYGFGQGVVLPILNTKAIVHTPASRRGCANAPVYMAMDLGTGAGAALLGIAADIVGIRWIYLLSALICLIGIGIHFYSVKYDRKKHIVWD